MFVVETKEYSLRHQKILIVSREFIKYILQVLKENEVLTDGWTNERQKDGNTYGQPAVKHNTKALTWFQ